MRHVHQIVAPYSPRRSERTGVRPAESEPTLGPEGHAAGRGLRGGEECVVWQQRLAVNREKADDASPCAQMFVFAGAEWRRTSGRTHTSADSATTKQHTWPVGVK